MANIVGALLKTNQQHVLGSHNKLINKVNRRSPLYLSVTPLHDEASQISMNNELLEMKCLKRRQRKKYVGLCNNCLCVGTITKKKENVLKNF